MNKSDTKPTPKFLAEILYMMSKYGFEAELKPDQLHVDLILGHKQPIPQEIVVTLRENGFKYCFDNKGTYTDADGVIRYRSVFRRLN